MFTRESSDDQDTPFFIENPKRADEIEKWAASIYQMQMPIRIALTKGFTKESFLKSIIKSLDTWSFPITEIMANSKEKEYLISQIKYLYSLEEKGILKR